MATTALQFTILTVAHSGETRGVTWAEIDLDASVSTNLADCMKAAKEHRIPLSAPVVDILQKIQSLKTMGRKDAAVFPGRTCGHLSGMAMNMLSRRMKRGDSTVHGF